MRLLSNPDCDVFISRQLPYAGTVTEEAVGASVPPDPLKKKKKGRWPFFRLFEPTDTCFLAFVRNSEVRCAKEV